MSWFLKLVDWFLNLYTNQIPSTDNDPIVPVEVIKPPVEPSKPTNREILLETAVKCLGKDMSPRENELGCAESAYFVMKKAGVPMLPAVIYSTALFEKWLVASLEEVTKPLPGDIVISATKGDNVGHMGFVGENGKVLSNNSTTFLFSDHWNMQGWLAYYTTKKGLKTRYFRWA